MMLQGYLASSNGDQAEGAGLAVAKDKETRKEGNRQGDMFPSMESIQLGREAGQMTEGRS